MAYRLVDTNLGRVLLLLLVFLVPFDGSGLVGLLLLLLLHSTSCWRPYLGRPSCCRAAICRRRRVHPWLVRARTCWLWFLFLLVRLVGGLSHFWATSFQSPLGPNEGSVGNNVSSTEWRFFYGWGGGLPGRMLVGHPIPDTSFRHLPVANDIRRIQRLRRGYCQ